MGGMRLLILVILAILLAGCSPSYTPEVDTSPRYTADQVIAVVKAKYPYCFRRGTLSMDSPPFAQSSISVTFVPSGRYWECYVKCPDGYAIVGFPGTRITSYFLESDGSLRSTPPD